MNDKLKAVLIGVLLLILGALGYKEYNIGGGNFSTEIVYIGNTTATSTPNVYLTAGATSSTLRFPCDNTDQINLHLGVVASSSASKVQWDYAFSDDNTVWYYESYATTDSTSTITQGGYTITHYYTPYTTATSSINVPQQDIASKFCQIRFAVSGANAGILGEAIKKTGF